MNMSTRANQYSWIIGGVAGACVHATGIAVTLANGRLNGRLRGCTFYVRLFARKSTVDMKKKTMSEQSIDNNRIAQLNQRLHDLRDEPSVVIQCTYNDCRISGTGRVVLPLSFYQHFIHLNWQIHPGTHLSQGQYVFVRYRSGDQFLHRMIVRHYLGKDACDGLQIHHRDGDCTVNSIRNIMLVTAQQNSSARGPSNATTKSLPGVKGVQARRNRYVVEFQCGPRSSVPKITATLPLSEKTLALALYNKISRHFNVLAFQNAHDPLTPQQQTRLGELFNECMVRYRKRQTVFEANGGRPTKRTRS